MVVEQAKADARKAMRLSPRDSRKGVWYSYLGLAELAQGRYDTSIEEYQRALELVILITLRTHSSLPFSRLMEKWRKREPPWPKPAA